MSEGRDEALREAVTEAVTSHRLAGGKGRCICGDPDGTWADHVVTAILSLPLLTAERERKVERAADALIHHRVPSPVSPDEIEMSGVFGWDTLVGIARAALSATDPGSRP